MRRCLSLAALSLFAWSTSALAAGRPVREEANEAHFKLRSEVSEFGRYRHWGEDADRNHPELISRIKDSVIVTRADGDTMTAIDHATVREMGLKPGKDHAPPNASRIIETIVDYVGPTGHGAYVDSRFHDESARGSTNAPEGSGLLFLGRLSAPSAPTGESSLKVTTTERRTHVREMRSGRLTTRYVIVHQTEALATERVPVAQGVTHGTGIGAAPSPSRAELSRASRWSLLRAAFRLR